MALSTYYTSYLISVNADLKERIAACAQEQADVLGKHIGDPESWAMAHRWEYATAPGWVSKVQSAIDTGITAWGADAAVLTDADLLSWVQPKIQQEPDAGSPTLIPA